MLTIIAVVFLLVFAFILASHVLNAWGNENIFNSRLEIVVTAASSGFMLIAVPVSMPNVPAVAGALLFYWIFGWSGMAWFMIQHGGLKRWTKR